MSFSKWLSAACISLLVCSFVSASFAREIRGGRPGEFDFYVLSLSWSPSFCADEKTASDNRQQCGTGKSFGFIVHGLWPQFKGGDWPAFCRSNEPQRVPDALARDALDIMPGFGLIGHQWRKHGVCSGLNQQAYFELARQARDKIVIPPVLRKLDRKVAVNPLALEAAFSKFNPGLDPEEMGVSCEDNRFLEMRLCLTPSLEFRDCPSVDLKGCKRGRLVMPPIR
ncbi:MAG: ribonuclease [Alphaproteobacteria bacterium]|nr:ribonuclease [Alphaproteobacteria bacterium]